MTKPPFGWRRFDRKRFCRWTTRVTVVALFAGLALPFLTGTGLSHERKRRTTEQELLERHGRLGSSGVTMTETWLIRWGGRMYANWADELGQDLPKKTHPAYPAFGKKKGAVTWRCKECHGWDYMGKDGAYGKGSPHYTGIKGITALRGGETSKIEKIIMNKTHAYTKDMIPPDALDALAMFISWGQIDMDRFIDRKTKRASGNLRRGAEIYQTVCAVCHGLDGREINFESADNPEYIGTVARDNPWETLHNIRFGHSGDAMVGLIAFPVQDQVDALSYAQTLPEK